MDSQLFSGRHGDVPSPAFIDADPNAFLFVLDFLRAKKDRVPPPTVPEAMIPSIVTIAKRFGLTELERLARPAPCDTHSMSYEVVVQFYLHGILEFDGMDLHGYNFRGWRLMGINAMGCVSRKAATFRHANLEGCDFSYAS